MSSQLPALEICQQARLSRDARFDGRFFIAVKSTGIYCRTICKVRLPAESQVQYFASAISASQAGFRPCLRCRPDSAPGSYAWLGTQTTLLRALKLIDQGALLEHDLPALCQRLGISERYLRQLFAKSLGISPKHYSLYQQALFAKQLLHQSNASITAIAQMSGFSSARRLQAAFKERFNLTPSAIRRQQKATMSKTLTIELSYRPPLAWSLLLSFWQQRTLDGFEWCTEDCYGRVIDWPPGQGEQHGWFEVRPHPKQHALQLQLQWPDASTLWPVVRHIRRMLDLDAEMTTIEQHLTPMFGEKLQSGLRIPGVWSVWEAGIRAILGQQVSVAGARTQLNRLLELGQPVDAPEHCAASQPVWRLFPTAHKLATDPLLMIKVPEARRATLRALATFLLENPDRPPTDWLPIKGIGPWTVAYASMRGLSEPDVWLGGDLGVQKALTKYQANQADAARFDLQGTIAAMAPWRSYATLQLWFSLAE